MTKSKKFIILFGTLILACAVVLYLLNSGTRSQRHVSVLEDDVVTNDEVQLPQLPAPEGWKVYKNTEWGLLLAYPRSSILEESYVADNIDNIAIEQTDDCTIEINKIGRGLPISWKRSSYVVGQYNAASWNDEINQLRVVSLDVADVPLKNRVVFWFENVSPAMPNVKSVCEQILSTVVLF